MIDPIKTTIERFLASCNVGRPIAEDGRRIVEYVILLESLLNGVLDNDDEAIDNDEPSGVNVQRIRDVLGRHEPPRVFPDASKPPWLR